MFIEPKPFISYKHIEAKSPQELERLMIVISVKSQHPVSFSVPSFSNGKWHSWFLYDWINVIKAKEKFEIENQS